MRILVLSTSRPGHRALKDMQCDLVGFIQAKDAIASDFQTGYCRLFYFDEDTSVNEYVELAKVLHHVYPFDAVCSFNDNAQHIAIAINQALELPYSLTDDVLQRVYNKNLMRLTLRKAGLDNTPHALVTDHAGIASFAEDHGYPMILKPVDATGSKGVSLIDAYEHIESALRYLNQGDGNVVAIVERFIEGKELSIEAFSEDGHHQVIAITEKFKDPLNFIEIGHVVPAPLSVKDQELVVTFVVQVLECLGVQDGPTHTEIILSENGPVIIETHTRPGGDRIDQLVKIAYGIDIFKLAARQVMGEQVLVDAQPPTSHRYGAIWFAAPEMTQSHYLKAVNNLSLAEQSPGIKEVKIMLTPGSTLHRLQDSFSRGAFAVAEGDSYEEALERAKKALAKLEFVIRTE